MHASCGEGLRGVANIRQAGTASHGSKHLRGRPSLPLGELLSSRPGISDFRVKINTRDTLDPLAHSEGKGCAPGRHSRGAGVR